MKKIRLNKKHKTEKSKKWLLRHINDEYLQRSKKEGYRSRSAYKLKQINEKFKIFNTVKEPRKANKPIAITPIN